MAGNVHPEKGGGAGTLPGGAGGKNKKFVEKDARSTFAEGGNTPMFGHQNADEQAPGGTAHDNGSPQSQGSGDKWACGGKTKMFGFAGAMPAREGITSAR